MDDTYHHEVDLLLSCGCVVYETIEGAVFTPLAGETRHCAEHNQDVTIKRVGYPYRVEHGEGEHRVTGRYINKKGMT